MSEPTPIDGSAGPTQHITWAECAARLDPAKARTTLEYLQHHPELWPAMRRVAVLVEGIRAIAGCQPIRVTCGLRPGDERQHGSGQALDLQMDGVTPRWLARVIRDAVERDELVAPRQVIAESTTTAGLDRPMSVGCGAWVHVAVFGASGERWTEPSTRPWHEIVTGGR